jgi:hypothetical protein
LVALETSGGEIMNQVMTERRRRKNNCPRKFNALVTTYIKQRKTIRKYKKPTFVSVALESSCGEIVNQVITERRHGLRIIVHRKLTPALQFSNT